MIKNGIKNKNFVIFISVILLLIIGFHVWSYQFYKQAWYDSIIFHSITNSLLNGEWFKAELNPLHNSGRPAILYGPVYFLAQAFLISIFGIGDEIYLLLGVLMIIPFLWAFIKQKYKYPLFYLLCGLILLFTDNAFSDTIHSGRMDIIATFISFWIFLITINYKKDLKQAILIGLLTGFAVLTTPRIGVVILPSLVYITYVHFFKISKSWKCFITIVLIPLFMIITWIYIGYGGFIDFYEYIFVQKSKSQDLDNSLASTFLGGNFRIFKFHYLMVLFVIIQTIYSIVSKKTKVLSALDFLPLIIMMSFYLLIFEVGSYCVIFLPIVYFYIITSLSKMKNKLVSNSILLLFLFQNIFFFSIKSSHLIVSYDTIQPETLNNFIKENIPEDSNILGSELFYYATLETNNDFRLWTTTEIDVKENIHHIHHVFNPDFILLTKHDQKNFMKYDIPFELKIKDSIDIENQHVLDYRNFLKGIKLNGNFINDRYDYDGSILYEVIK